MSDNDDNPGVDLDTGRREVGSFLTLLREINDIEYDITLNGPTDLKILSKDNKIAALAERRTTLPNPGDLDNIVLSCPDDTFLEVLMGNLRNAIISFQSWVSKLHNLKKSLLVNRINSLRDDFLINSHLISDLQEELNRLVESAILDKIKSLKLFEGLNSEKPSPIFLALAKNRGKGSLNQMRDDTGSKFYSDLDQGEYIAKFFENLYTAPPDEDLVSDTLVEDFLGEAICSSDMVRNSKLTRSEFDMLEQALTVEELDKSINNCNLRSAPGTNGFSNIVIKKCWPFLQLPLHRYALCCYNKGELTANFRGAGIKLIPKKGECSSIKNWRPISLLSNMYKIISRALNSRLEKVVNRICSRAQKGFNSNRYTQEVLINVWETISLVSRIILMAR